MCDYAFVWAKWRITCPADRTCQVGMGVFAGGEPRGEKIRFNGAREFVTIGIGAVHAHVVDGRGPCDVSLDILDKGLFGGTVGMAKNETGIDHDKLGLEAIEQFNSASMQMCKNIGMKDLDNA